MPTFANDPVRVNITREDILNLRRRGKTVKKGINLNFERDFNSGPNIWFLQCSGVSDHPNDPTQEIYKDHIDRQLEILGSNIVQDKIKERYIDQIMPKDPTIQVQQKITKNFSKENRYDLLIDKATNIHDLYYPLEKKRYKFATISGHHIHKIN